MINATSESNQLGEFASDSALELAQREQSGAIPAESRCARKRVWSRWCLGRGNKCALSERSLAGDDEQLQIALFEFAEINRQFSGELRPDERSQRNSQGKGRGEEGADALARTAYSLPRRRSIWLRAVRTGFFQRVFYALLSASETERERAKTTEQSRVAYLHCGLQSCAIDPIHRFGASLSSPHHHLHHLRNDARARQASGQREIVSESFDLRGQREETQGHS